MQLGRRVADVIERAAADAEVLDEREVRWRRARGRVRRSRREVGAIGVSAQRGAEERPEVHDEVKEAADTSYASAGQGTGQRPVEGTRRFMDTSQLEIYQN